MSKHAFSVTIGDRIIPLGDLDYQDGITIAVDGKTVLGLDLFYMASPDEEDITDPNPDAPSDPHVNVGHWPDGEEWELLAHIPVPVEPQT